MFGIGGDNPCEGKDCRDCETCIWDRDIFHEEAEPKEKVNVNLKDMCDKRVKCNGCPNLIRDYDHCVEDRFDAACRAVHYEAFDVTRPRRIDYNIGPNQDIMIPSWCPLKPKSTLGLPTPSQVTTRPYPQQTGPSSQTSPTYTKREKMKELRKHIEWADIEEGKIYLIPKILTQSRKLVKVITKTNMSCTCHEISEYTGNEYNYNCSFYPSDLDAVFITELKTF